MLGWTPKTHSYSLTASFSQGEVMEEDRAEAKTHPTVCLCSCPPQQWSPHPPVIPAPYSSMHLLELTFPNSHGASLTHPCRIPVPVPPPQRAGLFLESADIQQLPFQSTGFSSGLLNSVILTTPICFLGYWLLLLLSSDTIIHWALLMSQQ